MGVKEESLGKYYVQLILAGFVIQYIVNAVDFVIMRKLHFKDALFQDWLKFSKQNTFVAYFLRVASLLTNHNGLQLIYSKLFGFTFLSAKLSSLSLFFACNVLNIISIVVVKIPIIIGCGFLAYESDTESQLYVSCLDAIVLTILNIIFIISDVKKSEKYFDNPNSDFQQHLGRQARANLNDSNLSNLNESLLHVSKHFQPQNNEEDPEFLEKNKGLVKEDKEQPHSQPMKSICDFS